MKKNKQKKRTNTYTVLFLFVDFFLKKNSNFKAKFIALKLNSKLNLMTILAIVHWNSASVKVCVCVSSLWEFVYHYQGKHIDFLRYTKLVSLFSNVTNSIMLLIYDDDLHVILYTCQCLLLA